MDHLSATISDLLQNKWIQCILVLFIAFLLTKIISAIIRRTLRRSVSSRSETLIRIAGKLASFFIYMLALMQCCQLAFSVQPTSIIAATGVVGVALGFGAQSLVKDIISGFFLLLENQISVGDLVTIGGFTGTITELTLRSTVIKNALGDVFIIPNGSIDTVTNHSKSERTVLIDVDIAYSTDIDFATKVMQNVASKANQEITAITKAPEVLGVAKLNDSGVKMRMAVNCIIGEQFAVEREMLRRIKDAFDENGIEIPYQHIVIANKTIQ